MGLPSCPDAGHALPPGLSSPRTDVDSKRADTDYEALKKDCMLIVRQINELNKAMVSMV